MNFEGDVRWKQRFSNFDRAFVLLRSAFDENLGELSMLEQEGVIQRFEYTYELAWKTLKDYLEYGSGHLGIEITARNIFKEAFAAGIIDCQDVFVDMMLCRNLLSHTYDFEKFKGALEKIKAEFLPALDKLHSFFLTKINTNYD